MKRIAIILALTAIALTALAGIKSTIKGNGNVTGEERQVTGFHAVSVSDGIDLHLTQGKTEALNLEADENLMEHIITEVKDGVLKIYSEENFKDYELLKAHLTFKNLDRIDGSSGADVYTENMLKTDEMEIEMSSGSDLRMKLQATKAWFDMSSGSDGFVEFDGKALEIDASSGSDMEIDADELDLLSLYLSSGSDVELHGSGKELKINSSSGSDLDAFDFVAVNVRINATSASDADVTVMGNLDVNASSASQVSYKGKPDNVRVNTSSLASIRKK